MTNVIGKMITNSNRFVSKTDLGNVDLSNYYYYGFFGSQDSPYSDESGALRYNASVRNAISFNVDNFVNINKTNFMVGDKSIAYIQPGTRPTFGVRPSAYNDFEGLDDGAGGWADVMILDDGKPTFGDVVLAQSCLGTDNTSGNPYGTITISRLNSGLEIKLSDVAIQYANQPHTYTYTIPKEKFIDETVPKRLLIEIQAAGGAGSSGVWNGGQGNGGGAGAYWCGVVDLTYRVTIRLGNSYAGPSGGNGTPGQAGNDSEIYNQYGTTYLTVRGGAGGVYGDGTAAAGGTIVHTTAEDSSIWTISELNGGYGGTYSAAGQGTSQFNINSSSYLSTDATGWQSQQLSRGGHISGSNGGDGAWGGASAFSDGGKGSTSYYERIGGFGSGGAGGDDGSWGVNNDGGHGGTAVCLVHLPVKEKVIDWF